MTIPLLILSVVSNSLIYVLVPFLAGEESKTITERTWFFICFTTILFSTISFFLYITAAVWVPLLFPGFKSTTITLTIELTRIQLIGMIFTAINSVQIASFNAKHRFIFAEFTLLIPAAISVFLLYFLLPNFGILAAAWINNTRLILQTILLTIGIGMPVLVLSKDINYKEFLGKIRPLVLGNLYYKSDILVDRFLLSMSSAGSLSLYYFSQQIYNAINQVISKTIISTSVPTLSELHKKGNRKNINELFVKKIIILSIILTIIFIFMISFSELFLSIYTANSNLSKDNISQLWYLFIYLAGYLIGAGLGQMSASAFYACGNTRTPTKMSVINYTIYVPFKIIAYMMWGIKGLALSTSIYFLFNSIILIILFGKMINEEH